MRNPEQGPTIPEPSNPEVPELEILGEEKESDEEYKNRVLRELYKDKLQYSRDLDGLKKVYEEAKSKGRLTKGEEEKCLKAMDSLRQSIIKTTQEKEKAERQFDAYEKRKAA